MGIAHGVIATHPARPADAARMRELRETRQLRFDVDPESEVLGALWVFALLGKPQEDLLAEYLDAWPLELTPRAKA